MNVISEGLVVTFDDKADLPVHGETTDTSPAKGIIRAHPEYKIIDSFCPEKLFGCKIFDFVWQVFPRQRWIIDNWAKHFKNCGEPFLVTEERRHCWDSDRKGNHSMLRLWKKLECGDHGFVEFDKEMMRRWN